MNRSDLSNLRRAFGQTKSAGFEIGARRSFSISVDEAWKLVTSEEGLNAWLGELSEPFELAVGSTFTTKDGARGKIRVLNPLVNIRMAWQPEGWLKPSTLQVRTISEDGRAVIAFHQEQLPGALTREEMKQRWQLALENLDKLLEKRVSEGE